MIRRANQDFIIKGDICWSVNETEVRALSDHYLICSGSICRGVFSSVPEKYAHIPVTDYSGCLVIPGLTDLHAHAPQYSFRALGMDRELLDWLDTYAFPEEAKYRDADYAAKAYGIFAQELRRSATTRICLFSTIHRGATLYLMELIEKSGVAGYVGKVCMNRNAPEELCEKASAEETRLWIEACEGRFERVKPIITPRFVPSCTDELLKELADLAERYDLPVQSHLSENPSELKWVKELCPWSSYYGQVYERFRLFGGSRPTVMAHCIYSPEEEIRAMKEQGVFIAHCPQSNMNLASGIAPVRSYLSEGMRVGLGSDVAGGAHLSIFRAMTDAIQVSKLYCRLTDAAAGPLTVAEAFYLGTAGGGSFFGKVGRFEDGYEADAVVIDDSRLKHPQPLTLMERLERVIYLSDDRDIRAKYVMGRKVL